MKCHFKLRPPLLVLTLVAASASLAWSQATQTSSITQSVSNSSSSNSGGSVSSVVLGSGTYKIGPGDLLNITIYGDPELSRDCRVSGDGNIVLALLRARVKAEGKTPEEIQESVANAYIAEGILKNPQPTIKVIEFRSSPVTFLGAVAHPGTIQVAGTITLLQGIAAVGDFARDAGGNITITSAAGIDKDGMPTATHSLTIPQREVYKKTGDLAVNVELHGGDIVSVARTEFVYVGGAVGTPRMLPMTDVPNWSILTALVAAGNTTKFAKMDGSFIVRAKPDGGREWIPVHLKRVLQQKDPDQPLYANDILLVPTSYGKMALARAAESVMGVGQSALLMGVTGVP